MMAKLRYMDARGEAVYVPLDQKTESCWLGRTTRCAVRSSHLTVSSEHCRIFAQGEHWLIENFSRNGTLVNGREIQGITELRSGDDIACGRLRGLEVTFLVEPAQPAAMEPSQSVTLIAAAPRQPLPVPDLPAAAGGPSGCKEDAVKAAHAELAVQKQKLQQAETELAGLREQLERTAEALAQREESLESVRLDRGEMARALSAAQHESAELRAKCKQLDLLANERRQETIRYQAAARDLESRLTATEATLAEAMRTLTEERKKTSQLLTARDEWERRKLAYESKLSEQARDHERLHQRFREALQGTKRAAGDVGMLLDENESRVSDLEQQKAYISKLEKQVEQLTAGIRNYKKELEEERKRIRDQELIIAQSKAVLDVERRVAKESTR